MQLPSHYHNILTKLINKVTLALSCLLLVLNLLTPLDLFSPTPRFASRKIKRVRNKIAACDVEIARLQVYTVAQEAQIALEKINNFSRQSLKKMHSRLHLFQRKAEELAREQALQLELYNQLNSRLNQEFLVVHKILPAELSLFQLEEATKAFANCLMEMEPRLKKLIDYARFFKKEKDTIGFVLRRRKIESSKIKPMKVKAARIGMFLQTVQRLKSALLNLEKELQDRSILKLRLMQQRQLKISSQSLSSSSASEEFEEEDEAYCPCCNEAYDERNNRQIMLYCGSNTHQANAVDEKDTRHHVCQSCYFDLKNDEEKFRLPEESGGYISKAFQRCPICRYYPITCATSTHD